MNPYMAENQYQSLFADMAAIGRSVSVIDHNLTSVQVRRWVISTPYEGGVDSPSGSGRAGAAPGRAGHGGVTQLAVWSHVEKLYVSNAALFV